MDIFASIERDIAWAESLVDRAEAMADEHVSKNNFKWIDETDPDTGIRLIRLKMVSPPPEETWHLLRNALLDLKHSFDRSIYAAAQHQGFTKFRSNFPWCDTADNLEKKIEEMRAHSKAPLPADIEKVITDLNPVWIEPRIVSDHNVVRELANLANRKHDVGIAAVPHVRPSHFNLDMAFNTTRLFGPWDLERGEMVIAEIPPDGYASISNVAFEVPLRFFKGEEFFEVPAIAATRIFAAAARDCFERFRALCT